MFKWCAKEFHIDIQDLDDNFYVSNPVGRTILFCYGSPSRKIYLNCLSDLFWQGSGLAVCFGQSMELDLKRNV